MNGDRRYDNLEIDQGSGFWSCRLVGGIGRIRRTLQQQGEVRADRNER